MWGDQWVCECGWSNNTLRSKCRHCHAERQLGARTETPFEVMENVEKLREQENLEAAIAAKSREIDATGLCQWGYRTAEELAVMPEDDQ